jgi:hypothetical protein
MEGPLRDSQGPFFFDPIPFTRYPVFYGCSKMPRCKAPYDQWIVISDQ